MKKFLTIALLSITAVLPSAAARNVLDLKHSLADSAIVYPESFEVDTQRIMESWYMRNYTATDDAYRTKPDVKVSDEVIIRRLKEMPTVIEMPFNLVVRSYIERYTTKGGRAQVAAMLGLSNYYTPIFEQALEARGLPLELKYLPVIESALDPNAVSRAGATGLWQFMLGAARGLGMEVNSLVDERRDPYVSSEKAAEFLEDLYSAYGDWTLAIAAYNCGPGNVNKALRRAGTDANLDFWNIYRYLSPETRGYVPAFIAANYVMTYYPEHNISPVLATKPLVTDTVKINTRLHFNQISAVLDIPVDELRILNPQFRADIIPGTPSRTYNLILPTQQIHAYILSEKEICNYEADRYAQREVVEPGVAPDDTSGQEFMSADDTQAEQEVEAVKSAARQAAVANQPKTAVPATAPVVSGIHKVVAGETLSSIAAKYNVTIEQIKEWNGLRRNAVRTGQQLRITGTSADVAQNDNLPRNTRTKWREQQAETQAVQAKPAAKSSAADKAAKGNGKGKNTKKKESAAPASHTVTNGESLARIAKRYGTTVEALQKANKQLDGTTLHPGDKLNLPKGSKNTTAKSKKSGSGKSSGASSKSKKGGKKKRR